MLYNRMGNKRISVGFNNLRVASAIGPAILMAVLTFGSSIYGSETADSIDNTEINQFYARLLADEETIRKNIPDGEKEDESILRFGVVDVTGDGQKDLIVSKDELGNGQNGNTCFFTIENGMPCLIGALKMDPMQKTGYHADSGYVYLYTEEENGGQKVELLSFPEDLYDAETGENNCAPFMTFSLSPDKDKVLHCYVDDNEVSEKEFSKSFIKILSKPAPFYEDEYYSGWDGYEPAAEIENTAEERVRILGSDGSTILQPETETEAVIVETEAVVIETEVAETEVPKMETEMSSSEAESESEEDGMWICPECGNKAMFNFCGNCGTANPSTDWICPNCKENASGNFCGNCGTARP